MGDRVRELLYPLLLPTIVAIVWFSGWVRQVDDRMGGSGFPPIQTQQPTHVASGNRADAAGPPAAVPFVDESDVMATADDGPVIGY